MRNLLLLFVFSLVACSGRTNRPNKYPKPDLLPPPDLRDPMEINRLGEEIDEAWPPTPATPGKPLLRVVDPLRPYYYQPPTMDFERLPKHPGNQHYELVRRYQLGGVVRPRLTVSPDGKGIAIAPNGPDQVIVLYDVDDPRSERVVHLGKPKNIGSRWRGYRAYEVAWCGGDTPTLYVVAAAAMWALDPKTLETLPGWPIARTTQRYLHEVICLADGAAATSEGIGGPTSTGSITVFERDGTERFSRWVYKHHPYTLALTDTGLILTASQHGILLLDPNDGRTIHKATHLAGGSVIQQNNKYHFRGLMAASPTEPIIAIDHYSKPFQASIPELRFRSFPDIDKLRAIDRFNANDKSVPMKSDNHRLAIDEIGMMNYSRDGRDLLVSGKESTRRRGPTDVIWVIRDGKLYDTLVGQTDTGTDVDSLSDGRIVSLTGGNAEIFIWAPKKTPEPSSPPASPQAAD